MLSINGLLKSRLMFPELSESEFQILMHYSQGMDIQCIADIMKCSVPAVKQSLQRTKRKLGIDKLESARGIYNARIQAVLVAPDDFPANYYEAMQKNNSRNEVKNVMCE